MNKLYQSLLTTLLAAGISGAAFAAPPAAGGPGPGSDPMMAGEHHQGGGDRLQHFQRRQTELHDKLKLDAKQEAAWKTYIAAIQPSATQQPPQREDMRKLPAPERVEKMLTAMREREAMMSKHLEAMKVFYATLSPLQKQIFDDNVGGGAMMQHHRHR
ncbi:Spy/CpxP family protein refolding chaperone [Noviherbaspirillum pedocola]|uniref:Spy/CpxP family protein refolding chaperone n=1 Tax=Noviherbaspirillum pedocola TaxID=2801341 RepID=A0A934SRH4_9BURK|nr:Spy/CpxP family protein refolding chaperone [Noviherbaspirillum pedocola]MBK4734149.1 Spy/CpxP family protein refolding chaperone [Noviherbaspirillum pedocola]